MNIWIMRSRSSRLFMVLLHLVGVSTNMPRPWGNKGQHKLTGIVGVHPMAILMEHLDEPLLQAGGLGGLLQHLEAAGYDAQDLLLERQPYWLQDNHHHHHTAPHTQHNADGQCLGPAGFSDCGDATLWLIHRRQRRPHRRRPHQPQQRDRRKQPHESNHHSHSKGNTADQEDQERRYHPDGNYLLRFLSNIMGSSSSTTWQDQYQDEEDDWEYALELVDVDQLLTSATAAMQNVNNSTSPSWIHKKRELPQPDPGECLLTSSSLSRSTHSRRKRIRPNPNHENKGNTEDDIEESSSTTSIIQVGSCTDDLAWTWRINGDGVLLQDDLHVLQKYEMDCGTIHAGLLGPTAHSGKVCRRRRLGPDVVSPSKESRHGETSSVVSSSRLQCLSRVNDTTTAVMTPCEEENRVQFTVSSSSSSSNGSASSAVPLSSQPQPPQQQQESSPQGRPHLVQFSLVQYQSTATTATKPKLPSLTRVLPTTTTTTTPAKSTSASTTESSSSSSVPISTVKPTTLSSISSSDESPASEQRPASREFSPPASGTRVYNLRGKSSFASSATKNDKRTPEDLQSSHVDVEQQQPQASAAATTHLPKTRRSSQSHASSDGPTMHPDLKPPSSLMFTAMGKHTRNAAGSSSTGTSSGSGGNVKSKGNNNEKQRGKNLRSWFQDATPTLLAGNAFSPTNTRSTKLGSKQQQQKHLLHHAPGDTQHDDAPHKPRKIPVHPYLAAAKNKFTWVDPQTGLEFLTDLSGWLGHKKKDTGRHTLVGVGQYMRTCFNIKVYGVALYVAKRDVLADSAFKRYAGKTAEELRSDESFYDHLMNMPSKDDETQGLFDRTLQLKLNMQLATQTMLSSLEADWSKLSDDHKKMLIDTTGRSRPADEAMLKKIKSKENSSNCSCGQSAPPEYEADPTCCARGTELAFTWRKTGELEVRLDGRVMDSWPRPDMASGIFFEYLSDDPISMDAREHFADGFPFLLAPLAQVKGASLPVMSSQHAKPSGSREKDNAVLRTFEGMTGFVNEQASEFMGWVQHSADGVQSGVAQLSDTARSFGEEVERRGSTFVNQVMTIPGQSATFFSSFSSRMEQLASKPREDGILSVLSNLFETEEKKEWEDGNLSSTMYVQVQPTRTSAPRGKVFSSSLRKMLGDSAYPQIPLTDEIVPIIHPTVDFTHKIFLAMVHCYLVLLLIVSLPGSKGTRTRLIVKRSGSRSIQLKQKESRMKESLISCSSIPRKDTSHGNLKKATARSFDSEAGAGTTHGSHVASSSLVPGGENRQPMKKAFSFLL